MNDKGYACEKQIRSRVSAVFLYWLGLLDYANIIILPLTILVKVIFSTDCTFTHHY